MKLRINPLVVADLKALKIILQRIMQKQPERQ